MVRLILLFILCVMITSCGLEFKKDEDKKEEIVNQSNPTIEVKDKKYILSIDKLELVKIDNDKKSDVKEAEKANLNIPLVSFEKNSTRFESSDCVDINVNDVSNFGIKIFPNVATQDEVLGYEFFYVDYKGNFVSVFKDHITSRTIDNSLFIPMPYFNIKGFTKVFVSVEYNNGLGDKAKAEIFFFGKFI